jgi:RimJ/RimL family protein N-acetyltransferase
MVHIHPIRYEEIERFISEPVKPSNLEDVRQFFDMQLETGETNLSWCFALDDGIKFSARIAYYTFPGVHPEYGIGMFAFDPLLNENELTEFLNKTTQSMNSLNGASIFTLEVRKPSARYEEIVPLFRSAGFAYSSARVRFNLDLGSHPPNERLPQELIERSGDEAGEEEFIKALAIITSDSLDTEDQLRIRTFGLLEAAKNYFIMERSRDTSIERWKLYYTLENDFAGLVIPQLFGNNKTHGTIGHIGVNPTMRRKGYGSAILSRAHAILFNAGVTTMVDECDSLNIPSRKILQQTGYVPQYEKEYYKKFIK